MRQRHVHWSFVCCILFVVGAACSKPANKTKNITDTTNNNKNQQPITDKISNLVQKPATHDNFKPVRFEQQPELTVALSHGKQQTASASTATEKPKAVTSALDAGQAQKILGRMAPLKSEKGDLKDFAKREKSQPAPRPGKTIKTPFPPPQQATPDASTLNPKVKTLDVLRYAPEGEVAIAPKISVTFNQPMVAVTSHTDTVKNGVPIEITPKVKGSWRWIGTRTVLFEPEGNRLPMATEYKVNIAAGTKSASGQALKDAKTFAFKTPAPKVKVAHPRYGKYRLNQIIFMSFDQQIDRKAVLEKLTVKSGVVFGTHKVVEATQAEIDKDKLVKGLVSNAKDGTWVAFRTAKELPYDSKIRIILSKGTPSQEGPRTTKSEYKFSFKTYGPLRIVRHRCGWRQCRPNDSFRFEFSNKLKNEAFKPTMMKVRPEIPGMNTYASWQSVYVNGRKQGRTEYTITVSKDVEDIYGQRLGKDQVFKIRVGSDYPSLSNTGGNFVTLDPYSAPAYSVYSVNYSKLRVKMYEVSPKHWGDFLKFQRDYYYDAQKVAKPPGKLIKTEILTVDAGPDQLKETQIPLNKALGGDNLGHLVLVIEPAAAMPGSKLNAPNRRPKLRVWVQATQIGLDGFVDHGEFLGWATSLKSGEPLEGVTLSLSADGLQGKTDSGGLTTIKLGTYSKKHDTHASTLIAKKGKDVAMLPEHQARYYYGRQRTSWYKQKQNNHIKWFVFDDRKMYKPKETVSIKGWIREVETREGGDIALPKDSARKVTYTVMGPRNNKIAEGNVEVKGLGGFAFDFKLPSTPNLGWAYITLKTSGGYHRHAFQIQEFRRPEFEVKVTAPKGPFIAGEDTTVEVNAKYYAGGALPGAKTSWYVRTTPSSFTPPNQSKFSFGMWTPWWMSSSSRGKTTSKNLSGKTDVTGKHMLKIDLGMIDPPKPMSVSAQASVVDVNRQSWSSSTNLLVHPSLHYVGLRSDKYFVEKGTPLKIEAIVADIDGNKVSERPIKVRAFRTTWSWSNGRYKEKLTDEQTCDVMSTATIATCVFKTDVGGQYKISATTADDFGRRNYTQITRWVSGGKTPKSREVKQEKVQMIPDQDDYQPGESAKILVQSPFVPAEGLLTIRRHGIETQKRFTMSKSTMTLTVPIKGHHVPNVYVQVNLTGNAKRLDANGKESDKLPRRPAFARGQLNLKVPPTQRKLNVTLTPSRKELEPGADTTVSVNVKDVLGKPANNAEVALVVVDESVLALSNYQMADPIRTFYTTRSADVRDYYLRSSIKLEDPTKIKIQKQPATPVTTGAKSAQGRVRISSNKITMTEEADENAPQPEVKMKKERVAKSSRTFGGGKGKTAANAPKIAVRSNFDALAAFVPAVKTDAQGNATIKFKMPDNLTRYRIMAVAVHESRNYGTGESNITARLPLMVRPSAPRFLNFGDKFQLPVVLQNQTNQPMTVQVAARATNVELTQAQAYTLTVAANDRVEVQFPATTAMAGIARFQVAASAGNWSDAAEFSLPVWTPATSEAFATYGVLDKGAQSQPVKTPEKVWTQFGGLHVTTSSTAVQALTDAFLYLYSYPYECAEQLSSRMISVAALRDVLEAFDAPGMPDRKTVDAAMARDIKKLVARQNYNGGFGFWRKGQVSWPFVSLHAAHALTRAKAKGYKVDAYVMQRSGAYLKRIERYIPHYYGKWTRRLIIAYSLYVRGLQGDKDTAKARKLIADAGKLENLPFESIGWLLGVMSGDPASKTQLVALRKFLANRVTETAGAAHFASNYTDGAHLVMHSDRRADGVILEALITDQPKSDLIPKIVRGLMAHRKKGRWGSTQENAMILLALDKYFNTYEKQTPNFVAKIWLGSVFAGQHKFKGRTTERQQVDVPMAYMAKADGAQNLIIQKTGPGRLYYRVGMTYAPKSLKLEPADHGFVVERRYEAVDNDSDVTQLKDGSWKIRAGAKVRIKLTMVAPTRRYHVALVDPLPAGLEAMNPALAVTGDLPQAKAAKTGRSSNYNRWWWWSRPWFEHQNMRDERVEAFSSLVWGGVHSYTYYARATTPGRFIVPPTKAEEMYSPETFGRTGTDIVIVE